MSKPKLFSMSLMQRIAWCLLAYPRAAWEFKGCAEDGRVIIEAYSDSDWAGCRKSRRSTGGGMLVVGGGVVKSWTSTQARIATSSGEAEYYASTRAAAEGLGLQSLVADLGWRIE